MEIKKENIMNAYVEGDNSVKKMLRTMFPDIDFEREILPVTERIKTFEDALRELGDEHPFVKAWNTFLLGCKTGTPYKDVGDLFAYFKLRIICAALNEGWQPKFTKNETRWYPNFQLWTEAELNNKSNRWKQDCRLLTLSYYDTKYTAVNYMGSYNVALDRITNIGAQLCLKTGKLAEYCGKQFIDIWADFYLIRK